jgi:hypothetical protein
MSILAPLQLWRDVEMFQAFDLDEVLVVEDDSWHVPLDNPPNPTPPWISLEAWGLNPEYNYCFDLFMGIFEKRASAAIVEEIYSEANIKADSILMLDDSRIIDGTTCVARMLISSVGELAIDDTRVSTLPWALTAIRYGKELSLDAFDSYGRDLLMRVSSCRGAKGNDSDNTPAPISWDLLRAINTEVRRDLSLEWREFADRIVIVGHRLSKKKVIVNVAEDPTQGIGASEALKSEVTAYERTESVTPTVGVSSAESFSSGELRLNQGGHVRIRRRCEILNSFFLRDLQRVALGSRQLSRNSPLYRYLLAEPHPTRVDVAKPSERLWQGVSLKALPLGRWPHATDHFNSLMQQLAVNEYMSSRHQLFAVNGPPGTGKTTLVKDIIAASVVQRALKLVRYRSPDDAFEKKSISVEVDRSRFVIRKLKRDLTGFEVVVASSNNNAVENITRELPKRSSLALDFQDSAYLLEVARLYDLARSNGDVSEWLNRPDSQWGLISAPLGNRRNRELFCDALLYGPREEKELKVKRIKEGKILSLHEWRKQVPPPGTISYSKARLDFLDAHKKVEEALEQLSREAVGVNSVDRLFNLPSDTDFDSYSVQARAPWLNESLNQAQARLFITALTLHQAWVREAPMLGPNLSALGKMLSRPDCFDEHTAAFIWQTLFMVIPAISTTLASVERMCASLGEGVFGTVIIEEAGQATPQSIAGLLWRAKRALVIGDPMQIQPVVSAPDILIRHFSETHKVSNPLFSPLASSAQALADESNELGAYLEHNVASTWVGAPLRVHRRCDEPMFSISNTIAYGGLMTRRADSGPDGRAQLGSIPESKWFDTDGVCVSRHWVPRHGEVACEILELVASNNQVRDLDIFFITPFRAVREKLAKMLVDRARALGFSSDRIAEVRRRVGTVHTFQGKEASIVTFVLGCDENSRGAARWAGERPNLLNVAVTRARHRLYVVGSLSLWHNQGFFSELASSLPRELR